MEVPFLAMSVASCASAGTGGCHFSGSIGSVMAVSNFFTIPYSHALDVQSSLAAVDFDPTRNVILTIPGT